MSDDPGLRGVSLRRAGLADADQVIAEEPMELRVEGRSTAITMRTPGHDLDLALGFLLGEGVIDGADDVRALAEVGPNVVDVRLAEGVPAARARLADRDLYATSSCGVCGKASLDRLPRPRQRAPGWSPGPELVQSVAAQLSASMPLFQATGGCHGAALFDTAGTLSFVREDVGRHNAVDKVIGWAVEAERIPLTGSVLLVSGRASFELTQKAVMAGVPVLAAVSAPSSLAVDLAAQSGLTLVAFLRGDSMNIYSRADRIRP
jgi:FdhD protein